MNRQQFTGQATGAIAPGDMYPSLFAHLRPHWGNRRFGLTIPFGCQTQPPPQKNVIFGTRARICQKTELWTRVSRHWQCLSSPTIVSGSLIFEVRIFGCVFRVENSCDFRFSNGFANFHSGFGNVHFV